MILLEVQIVKVGDMEFPVKVTNRAMIEYEKLAGGSIANMEDYESLLKFFYCTARAGAKATGKDFNYTYDQFIDLIDDYYEDTITNFSKAITRPGGGEKKEMPT